MRGPIVSNAAICNRLAQTTPIAWSYRRWNGASQFLVKSLPCSIPSEHDVVRDFLVRHRWKEDSRREAHLSRPVNGRLTSRFCLVVAVGPQRAIRFHASMKYPRSSS
jgi:hypothetical protein